MTENRVRVERARLRELARQTLEAFRKLNSAAAEASYPGNGKGNGGGMPGAENMSGAIQLLEEVLAEIKKTAGGARG